MTLAHRLTTRLRRMPIRQKLRVSFILTTVIALWFAGVGVLTADYILFSQYLQRDLATLVQIIGDNSTGTLGFDDPTGAAETLAALDARTHVQTACLYRNDGSRLALYVRPGYGGVCPTPGPEGIRRAADGLEASYKIVREGLALGSLVLLYDLEELPQRTALYGGIILLAIPLASLIALILSSKLRGLITEPILELAGATNAVSASKDYSIRAKKLSEDEVGELAEALNQMLAGIETRDENLKQALEAQREAATRLAQANADLLRSNTELERSNQDLERFAFAASHDLQEPLRTITAFSQLLVAERSSDPNSRAAQFADYIVSGTRRMRELLTDLLAYTEVAGNSAQTHEVVDLNVVLKKATETLGTLIAETGTEITAGPLPVLNAHEGRLTSLFLNFLSNAIKYRSEQAPRIRVRARETDHAFEFSVADNGIGIAPEYHRKVFDPFKRLHGGDIPGTGIGLAICQRIVERYGGRIWVESAEGGGATFCFTLPKSMASWPQGGTDSGPVVQDCETR